MAAPVFELIGIWAVLGIGGIAAGVAVALFADRLAHRRRTAAMAAAFERAITLPLSYHARAGSGRVVRTMLAGTDALFMIWLSFFREHLSALVGIACLVPTALVMNLQLAGLLAALAVVYVVVNLVVVRRTQAGQMAVERHHQDVFGRVGDVIGNVTVVQSYARLAAEAAAAAGHDAPAARRPVPRAHLVGAAHHPHPRLGHHRHGGDLRRRRACSPAAARSRSARS